MKLCLQCENEIIGKKGTALFCSGNCKVKHHRKNKGKSKGLKPEQMMSAIYNNVLELLSSVNRLPIPDNPALIENSQPYFISTKKEGLVEEKPSKLSEYFSLIDNAESTAQVENIVLKSKQDDLGFFDKKKIQEFGTAKCIKLGY